jgi:biotin carboxyl carrier protein
MRYYVSLDPAGQGAPATVDLNERATGEVEVTVGDKQVPVDVVWLDGAIASVRVGGRVVDLILEGTPPDVSAVANGLRCQVRVESDRQRAAAAARKGSAAVTDKIIKAPMPGRVVRVLVKPGATVEAGTTLCVIEAMKMENEVKAKAACTVVEVRAVEGATIEGGSKLFTLA